jgi:diphosphomevalonate decarboxylase
MTDAYFTKSIFLARLGSGCLPKCKRTSGSLGKPILKEALIYTESNFHTTKNFKNYQDTILLVDKGKQVSSTVGHDLMHDIPMPKGDLPKRTII